MGVGGEEPDGGLGGFFGPRKAIEDLGGVLIPGVFFADRGGGGGPEAGPKSGVEEALFDGFAELIGLGGIKEEAIDAVFDDLGDGFGAWGDGRAALGHGFEEFNGGAVFVAVGDDADIDGGEVVGDFVMGDRAGEDESIGDA